MAEVAKHPPGAGGRDRVAGVVDDDGPVVAHARGSHVGGERLGVGQRVAPARAGRRRELGVEVDEHRAGDMPAPVVLDPGRAAQRPADVEQRRTVRAAGDQRMQRACGDQ
jgi:hypothetical protein